MSIFSRRGTHHNSVPTLEQQLREQATQQLETELEQRLHGGQQTAVERLDTLLGTHQSRSITLGGLRRLTVYRLQSDMGGVIIPENDSDFTQLNIDVATDGSRIGLEARVKRTVASYQYMHRQGKSYFLHGDTPMPLTHPSAQEGLQRLEDICERLGSCCLTAAQA